MSLVVHLMLKVRDHNAHKPWQFLLMTVVRLSIKPYNLDFPGLIETEQLNVFVRVGFYCAVTYCIFPKLNLTLVCSMLWKSEVLSFIKYFQKHCKTTGGFALVH